MKKLFSVFVLTLVPALLLAGSHTYQVDAPQLAVDGGFTSVSYPGVIITGTPGTPQIPTWPVKLLLLPGEQATDVSVSYSGRVDLSGIHQLKPIQQPYPISHSADAVVTQPDPAVYQLDRFLPDEMELKESTQFLCGHGVLLAQAQPVRYNPATGELFYYSQFTISWNGTTANEVRSLHQRASNRIEDMVDNPRTLNSYSYLNDRPEGEYDYAVVTAPQLMDSFQPLVDFKNTLGIVTQMFNIFEIIDEYDGNDDAERLRNFLIHEYEEHGISYLLLAGDIEFVPWRGLYVNSYGTTDELPSDLYFAGLDGNWNTDGDGNWGEPGEDDLYAEIHVGRASVSNSGEADNFVNKQLSYQQSPVVADLESYLMIGENLDSNPTWGGDCKDQIVEGSSAHGMNTAGLPDNIGVEYRYDRDSYWSISQLFSQLGNGINVANHLGHCNWNYAMKMSNPDITNANFTSNGVNHNFHIGYSQGCIPGAFEYSDCIVERMTNLENGFACFVANSRYGWYQPSGSGGSSQLFDREFFDALNGEGIHRIGSTNQDSKEDLAGSVSGDGSMRWTYYCLNLFGDPTLSIWSSAPMEQNLTYSSELVTGMPEMELILMSDGEAVEDALVALTRNGVLYGMGETDADGELVIVFDEVIIPGEYNLTVSGHNLLPTAYDVVVIASDGPYLAYAEYSILDGDYNQNSQVEAGETVDMELQLHNYGSDDATDIFAILSTEHPQVTILEDETSFDPIVPDGDNVCLTPFSFSVDSECPDGTMIEFNLDIESDENSWGGSFYVEAHAPELTCLGLQVDDEINGQLDPGETRDLLLTVHNGGSGLLTGVGSLFTLTDEFITVDQNSCDLDEIAPGGSGELCFTVTAAPETPIGHTIEPGVLINGDLEYTAEFDLTLAIGLTVDGFETGDFSRMDWEMSGSADWNVDGNAPWEGNFSARSGSISDNSTSVMSISGYVIEDGEISFSYKVSSEGSYDFLRFYIDNNMELAISGEVSWMNQSFDVSEGEHTFTWRYQKDQNTSGGNDCGWIDYVVFPQFGAPPQPLVDVDLAGFNLVVDAGAQLEETLVLGNNGEAPLVYEVAFMDDALSYHYNMEADEASWNHDADDEDPWHVTDHDWNSDDHSWYLGEDGSWQYANNLHCWLETEEFEVRQNAQLTFWHRMDMEVAEDNYARDAGIIELSSDGENWSQVLPAGGYPYHYDATDGGPFNQGRPCFSGTTDWEQVQLNLSGYAGQTLQLRWRFGSGNSGSAEGWYIDDVVVGSFGTDWLALTPQSGEIDPDGSEDITVTINAADYYDTDLSGIIYITSNDPANPELLIPVAVEVTTQGVDEVEPLSFYLAQNYPNPFNPTTTIEYGLKTAGNVTLVIYNTLGQQIQSLVDSPQQAGHYQIQLDGSTLASGLYIYRLETAGFVATKKMVLIK